MSRSRGRIIIGGRRYKMTTHAKQRLRERFGLEEMPEGAHPQQGVRFISSTSNNRKVYAVRDVYFVINKNGHKIVTVLTEKEATR